MKLKCYICGANLSPVNSTVDHYIPRYLGGSNIAANRFPCCRACNQLKSNTYPTPYLLACVRWASQLYSESAGYFRVKQVDWRLNKRAGYMKMCVKEGASFEIYLDVSRLFSNVYFDFMRFMTANIDIKNLTWLTDKVYELFTTLIQIREQRDENLYRQLSELFNFCSVQDIRLDYLPLLVKVYDK